MTWTRSEGQEVAVGQMIKAGRGMDLETEIEIEGKDAVDRDPGQDPDPLLVLDLALDPVLDPEVVKETEAEVILEEGITQQIAQVHQTHPIVGTGNPQKIGNVLFLIQVPALVTVVQAVPLMKRRRKNHRKRRKKSSNINRKKRTMRKMMTTVKMKMEIYPSIACLTMMRI